MTHSNEIILNKDCKYITVLFVDIVKSSNIVAKNDPEYAAFFNSGAQSGSGSVTQSSTGSLNEYKSEGAKALAEKAARMGIKL